MTPTLRLATPEDGAATAAIYAPIVRETTISFEADPPDAAEMARRIGATLPAHPWIVAEGASGVLGYAYAGPHRKRAAYAWAVEPSVYVAAGARTRGVGRRLYGALLALLRAQGFAMAYAGVTLPNAPSLALHRACGFEDVGVYPAAGFKHGAWHAVWWGALRLGPLAEAPALPRALDALPPEAARAALGGA